MRAVFLTTLLLLSLLPSALQAQATRHWIAESTVTWGRGEFAYQGVGTDAVALADLGLRWSYPSGIGWGLSFAGGYDFPSEASLVGGRVRLTREWDRRRVEGSVSALVSSIDDGYLGASLGLAFYPWPWGAAVLQLDFIPTRVSEQEIFEQFGEMRDVPPTRDPALSFGARVGERAGVASWAAAAVLAAVSLVTLSAW